MQRRGTDFFSGSAVFISTLQGEAKLNQLYSLQEEPCHSGNCLQDLHGQIFGNF